MTTLARVAIALTMFGTTGAGVTMLHGVAMRRADWDLIPAAVRRRALRRQRRSAQMLVISAILTVAGLVLGVTAVL